MHRRLFYGAGWLLAGGVLAFFIPLHGRKGVELAIDRAEMLDHGRDTVGEIRQVPGRKPRGRQASSRIFRLILIQGCMRKRSAASIVHCASVLQDTKYKLEQDDKADLHANVLDIRWSPGLCLKLCRACRADA